jgi:hypothetical protein
MKILNNRERKLDFINSKKKKRKFKLSVPQL